MQALGAVILIEMKRDLAVRPCPEPMALLNQSALEPLEIVELAVHHDSEPFVFTGNGLVAGFEIDNAQPSMPQPDRPVRGDPLPPAVGPAVLKPRRRPLEGLGGDWLTLREHGDDSAHDRFPHRRGGEPRRGRPRAAT